MKKRLKLTWRASVALLGLATAVFAFGTPGALAQGPHTEVVSVPAVAPMAPVGGPYQVGGVGSGPSLNTVHVDDGRPGLSTAGGYAVPLGPACTGGVVGGAPGYGQVADASCGIGGGFAPPVEGGLIEVHYP